MANELIIPIFKPYAMVYFLHLHTVHKRCEERGESLETLLTLLQIGTAAGEVYNVILLIRFFLVR